MTDPNTQLKPKLNRVKDILKAHSVEDLAYLLLSLGIKSGYEIYWEISIPNLIAYARRVTKKSEDIDDK